jgi:hypothetical protein
MKTLALFCALLAVPSAFGQHRLPCWGWGCTQFSGWQFDKDKTVTLHGTMSAYDAYQAIGQILGVYVHITPSSFDKVKEISVTLDLNQATGEQAFNAISHQAKANWGIFIDHDDRSVMVFTAPPGPHP